MPGKRGGSTKDPSKAALKKKAEEIAGGPISDRMIHKHLAGPPKRPKSEQRGKRKPKVVPPFEDQAFKKWTAWVNKFPHERQLPVKVLVYGWIKPDVEKQKRATE